MTPKRLPLLAVTALATAMTHPALAAETPATLEGVKVQAARVNKPATALPYTITVITREQLSEQLALGFDMAQIIGNLAPAYSPSRQKMTGFGETLRGREPLFMIDGVPQSNPLRNGSRDGYTVDPDMIERIEIIHGANAIQGTGATGGIINIVTKTAEAGQEGETGVAFSFGANDDFDGDSFSQRLHLQHAGASGDLDYLFAAGLTRTGLYFDAEDRPIGVDNTQGDIMDGEGRDLFAKVGYSINTDQRLQFTANTFNFASNGDYVTQPGDPSLGIPSTSVEGTVQGEPAENDVTTVSLDYSHDALGSGLFTAQLYRQDFAAIYGGGTYGVFQDPSIGTNLFDQSRNQSEKTGLKLTYNLPELVSSNTDLTVGFDWLEDTTEQDLVQTGRSWVPETTYVNMAPFAQLNWRVGNVNISGGLRHEMAELDVNDFTTLAAYGNTFVEGGKPDFSETLYNLGANWKVTDDFTAFASYSEGFSMPDVGRVLRGISTPGLAVEDFLDLAPIIADNVEVGFEYRSNAFGVRASYFRSQSDEGARLVPDADGIFSVQREKTDIEGLELSATYDVSPKTRFGLDVANINARVDINGDGEIDSDLAGINVAPPRANLYWEQQWGMDFGTRLQANHLRDRNFDELGVQVAQFDGFTTFDLIGNWRINDAHRLQLGIENLADRQYITYFAQVYPFADYYAGRGRNLNLTWRGSF